MHSADFPRPLPSSISDVERDTGLAKETLRVWERRYAFPQPLRDLAGERCYPEEQVSKLRLVKRLIDLGFRPGKIMQHSPEQLRALAERSQRHDGASAAPAHGALLQCFELCKTQRLAALRVALLHAMDTMGLRDFVIDLVAPLTGLVEEAWCSGRLALFEEHLYTETLQTVLRHAIFSQATLEAAATPRILLTTLPQERHGLGLLMAEALYTAEGAATISLGLQTPLPDIVAAAHSQRADIVALSFSSAMNARLAASSLIDLRARLPQTIEIWAGGSGHALKKRPPAFIQVLALAQVQSALLRWRQRAGANAH